MRVFANLTTLPVCDAGLDEGILDLIDRKVPVFARHAALDAVGHDQGGIEEREGGEDVQDAHLGCESLKAGIQ